VFPSEWQASICLAGEITRSVEVAFAILATGNANVVESKVGARAITTENVVVDGIVSGGTSDVGHGDSGDSHAIGWVASWATVEVILLDINTVVADARDLDVLVGDAASR
jgi:hypothetical protein